MLAFLDPYRGVEFGAVVIRLMLALLLGGLLGLERIRKRRPAGIRTYMLVCIGAALTMMLGQYQAQMLLTDWSNTASAITPDISRLSAQVINGIGFLGAGTIIGWDANFFAVFVVSLCLLDLLKLLVRQSVEVSVDFC